MFELESLFSRLDNTYSQVILIFCLGLGLSAGVELFLQRVLLRWTRKTRIDWDEQLTLLIRRPLSASVFIFFAWKATIPCTPFAGHHSLSCFCPIFLIVFVIPPVIISRNRQLTPTC